MTSTTTNAGAPIAAQSVFSRPAALIGGAIGLVALTAVATTLALRSPSPPAADARSGASTPLMALSTPAGKGSATAPPEAPADFPEKMAPPAAAKPERSNSTAPAPQAAPKPVHLQRGTVQAAPAQRVASVCSTCGKVESVAAVKQKGEGTGIGVVGGAVVGGLLGSQVGGGSGKNVATVLGAVGGGVAGNEVEKRARATTMYQVRVRMDDGSVRTITQSSAPAVGQKVTVEGSTLRSRA
jgi:outer membrane lipoprotein SlyB